MLSAQHSYFRIRLQDPYDLLLDDFGCTVGLQQIWAEIMFHPWGIEETKVSVPQTIKNPDPNKWSSVKRVNGAASHWWRGLGKIWGDRTVRGRVDTGRSRVGRQHRWGRELPGRVG